MKKVSKYSYTWFISFIIELRSSRRKLYRDEILFYSSFICFTCFTFFPNSMNKSLQLC